jgi:rod shape-determining protein MreC
VQNSTPPLFKQGIPALAKLVVCLLIGSALMVVDFQVKSLDFIRNQVSYVLRPLENIMLLPSDLFSLEKIISPLALLLRKRIFL